MDLVTMGATIAAVKGRVAKGDKGDPGDDYVLTNQDKADIAALVSEMAVETVTGTDPVIVGISNTRYVCGEVSTISITPPQTGTIDVIFESGTSAAVLTLPNTVLMPEWFEVEANMIYEISITDGVYGAVMAWQA